MNPIKYSYSAYRGGNPPQKGKGAAVTLVVVCALLLGFSINKLANAKPAEPVRDLSQDAYVSSLEKTLARCLSPGDNSLVIGDEIWMCGATRTGIKAK